MKINFLDSGIDSLKKGYKSLYEYEKMTYYNPKIYTEREKYFHLKDAILFIQHGIEILFKKIIHQHSEYLLFSQLDHNVKEALKQKNHKNLSSIFETDLKTKIRTVTFQESIERLKIIPSVFLSKKLENKVTELELYRNIIMHSEPHINTIEIHNTLDGLSDELDNFFYKNIGPSYRTISGYSDLTTNIDNINQILQKKGLALKSKAIQIFHDAIKKANVSIGANEVKRVTDINKCTTFLTSIFDSELNFGTDLYNGYCSGDVKAIQRKENCIFSLFTNDNQAFFECQLRSIILYIPSVQDDESPIIFIESNDLDFDPVKYNNTVLEEYNKIQSLRYIELKTNGNCIFGIDEQYQYINENDLTYDDFDRYERFFTKGPFCFLNVQGLNYSKNYGSYIYKNNKIDGKRFEVVLRNELIN